MLHFRLQLDSKRLVDNPLAAATRYRQHQERDPRGRRQPAAGDGTVA